MVRNVTKDLKSHLESSEFLAKMDAAATKTQTYKAVVQEKLQALQNSEAEKQLRSAASELKQKSEELQTTLGTNIPLMESFLADCNRLFLGKGPDKEFLLDICAQSSDTCLENTLARHVTCCCAFHPFTQFGQIIGDSFIPGGVPGATTRRLQASGGQNESNNMDICASCWTSAAPSVAEVYKKEAFARVSYVFRGTAKNC